MKVLNEALIAFLEVLSVLLFASAAGMGAAHVGTWLGILVAGVVVLAGASLAAWRQQPPKKTTP